MLGLRCCGLFSSCGQQELLSSCGAQASHCDGVSVTEHRRGAAPGLWGISSRVAVHGLSCSKTSGIFLDQGLNPHLLYLQVNFYHWAIREAPEVLFILSFQWIKTSPYEAYVIPTVFSHSTFSVLTLWELNFAILSDLQKCLGCFFLSFFLNFVIT